MKLKICFVAEDFEPALTKAGLELDSITNSEWTQFENMFIEGTHWSYVAEIAAEEIAYERRLNE